jgi:hypothetical protein
MSQIALVTDNNIISKIFTLVSKRLSLDIDIYTHDEISQEYNFIVVDNDIAIDIKKIDSFTKKLILLSQQNTHNTFYDYVIKKPFLPSDLFSRLEEIIQNNNSKIKTENNKQTLESSRVDEKTHDLEKLVNSVVHSLGDEECEDDIVIDKNTLGLGGILDNDELRKLGSILDDSSTTYSQKKKEDEEWIELSQIVDCAIDELEILANNEIKPINLQINKQNIEEVRPLLRKLNQEIIDALVDGQEITLKLRLDNK